MCVDYRYGPIALPMCLVNAVCFTVSDGRMVETYQPEMTDGDALLMREEYNDSAHEDYYLPCNCITIAVVLGSWEEARQRAYHRLETMERGNTRRNAWEEYYAMYVDFTYTRWVNEQNDMRAQATWDAIAPTYLEEVEERLCGRRMRR